MIGKDTAAPHAERGRQGGGVMAPITSAFSGERPVCAPSDARAPVLATHPSLQPGRQSAGTAANFHSFILLGRPSCTCTRTCARPGWALGAASPRPCEPPAVPARQTPPPPRGLGQESAPGARRSSLRQRAVVLACLSHRWPQSSLKLPSPNSLFLFGRNFLLVIILILYLFSSAENWHLIRPARLRGGGLIDPGCITPATSRSVSSALCRAHFPSTLFICPLRGHCFCSAPGESPGEKPAATGQGWPTPPASLRALHAE